MGIRRYRPLLRLQRIGNAHLFLYKRFLFFFFSTHLRLCSLLGFFFSTWKYLVLIGHPRSSNVSSSLSLVFLLFFVSYNRMKFFSFSLANRFDNNGYYPGRRGRNVFFRTFFSSFFTPIRGFVSFFTSLFEDINEGFFSRIKKDYCGAEKTKFLLSWIFFLYLLCWTFKNFNSRKSSIRTHFFFKSLLQSDTRMIMFPKLRIISWKNRAPWFPKNT